MNILLSMQNSRGKGGRFFIGKFHHREGKANGCFTANAWQASKLINKFLQWRNKICHIRTWWAYRE